MKHKFRKPTKLENNIIIYDLETTGRNPYICEPIEISAICADINTLELKTDQMGNLLVFTTLVKPPTDCIIEEKALQKNKITLEMLAATEVPDQKFAFEQFCGFCRQFQRTDKKWDACYAAGFNIHNFDNIIMDRMCQRYEYEDKEGDYLLFHPFHSFDLFDVLRMYFCWDDSLTGYNMDSVRDYFGIDKEGSHRAEKDVGDCWSILKRFLSLYKKTAARRVAEFKGCFSGTSK